MFLQKLSLEKVAWKRRQAKTVRAIGEVKTKQNTDSVGEKKVKGIKQEWRRWKNQKENEQKKLWSCRDGPGKQRWK